MKVQLKYKLLISMLALAGIIIIFLGAYSISGSGFSLEYKNIDILFNKDGRFKAPSVFDIRFQLIAHIIILLLVWIKPIIATIISAGVCLAYCVQSLIYAFVNRISPKYDFFTGALDFCLFVIPFIMLALFIVMLIQHRKNKMQNVQN